MALVLDEDQSLIQDTAREFCAARAPVSQLRALRDARDELGYSPDVWRAMAELGWPGIVIPEERGGTGFGWQALGVILEETGRTLAASPLFSTVLLGAAAVLRGGTEAQQAELLPKVAAGELTMTLALEESPHHAPYGSALAARPDGGGWILDGAKQFVPDGHSAELVVVVARTAGEAGDREGLTLFLVPGDAPGLVRRRRVMADSRAVADLVLEGVPVQPEAVIGAPGAGADILDAVLDGARIGLAAEMLGTATEAFERTVAYLRERKQFGQLIGSFQGLKHRAADAFTELQLSRSVVMDALTALDEGRDDVPRLAALAKARMGETLNLVSREAIQMHGGIGMTDEYEIGFFLKRARVQEATLGGERFHRDRYAALAGF